MTSKFTVSPAAQSDYRILGGTRPSGAEATARAALQKAHASGRSGSVHVTSRDSGWAVKSEGSQRAASIQPTKAKAVAIGRAKASGSGGRLIEHGKDGKIVRNTKPVPKQK
ncbi:MAG: DUF2188 domain-containing protein [Candidatus Limnocylindrales bacterium]|jgi:hypothetical protein